MPGDSLTGYKIDKYISVIHDWISCALSRKFSISQNGSLPHARQKDLKSCGLYAINSIEHALFGDPLLLPSEVVSYRVRWFSSLANAHMSRPQVRIADLIEPITRLEEAVNRDPLTHDDGQRTGLPATVSSTYTSEDDDILPGDQASSVYGSSSSQASLVGYLDQMEVDVDEGMAGHTEASATQSSLALPPDDGRTSPSVLSSTSSKVSLRSFVRSISPKLATRTRKVVDAVVGGLGSLLKRKDALVVDDERPVKRVKKPPSAKKPMDPKPAGTSRSAIHERETRAKIKNGDFDIVPGKFDRFKRLCLEIDSGAQFDEKNPSKVWCSKCGAWKNVYIAYSLANFKKHRKECKGKGRMVALTQMAAQQGWTRGPTVSVAVKTETVPCPGITEKDDRRIRVYHQRSRAVGGGGKSITKIAKEKFQKVYSVLSKEEKKIVQDVQRKGHKWRNVHQTGHVYSTKCRENVRVEVRQDIAAGGTSSTKLTSRKPCAPCNALLTDPDFIRILKKKLPLSRNFIYTNKLYCDPELDRIYSKYTGLKELVDEDKETSPLLRYALGVASGKYSDDKLLAGLVQTVALKEEKEQRNVGMQNFQWPSEYSHFLHAIEIESPRAYRTLKRYLPARTQRSFA